MLYVIGFHIHFKSIDDLTSYGQGLANGIFKLLHPESEKGDVIFHRPNGSDDKDYARCQEIYILKHPSHKEVILVIEGDDVLDNCGEINNCIDAYMHHSFYRLNSKIIKLKCPFEKRLLVFDDIKEEVRKI